MRINTTPDVIAAKHGSHRKRELSNERIAWTLTGGVALVIIVMYSLEVCLSWVATHASH